MIDRLLLLLTARFNKKQRKKDNEKKIESVFTRNNHANK
jgi:hypothetical protein